jgi:hypothetical protein
MSRYFFAANALSVADFMPPPESQQINANDTIEQPPPTKRLRKLDLEAALAAMDLAEALENEESTLTVSAEDNKKLLAEAFRKNGNFERPNTDDEPTLDAPSPKLPPGIPSPLGDDDDNDHDHDRDHGRGPETSRGVMIPKWSPDVDLEQVDLDLHLDSIVLHPPPPPASEPSSEQSSGIRRASSFDAIDFADTDIPLPASEAPPRTERISLAVSGLRRTPATASVSPDTFKEVLSNRAAQRQVRQQERNTRYIVMAIWAVALIVAGFLTFLLMTTKTSTISSSTPTTTQESAE